MYLKVVLCECQDTLKKKKRLKHSLKYQQLPSVVVIDLCHMIRLCSLLEVLCVCVCVWSNVGKDDASEANYSHYM